MFDNWFKPLSSDQIPVPAARPFQLGSTIRIHQPNALPDLRDTKLALIGLDDTATTPIRAEFYSLVNHFNGLEIADLGNIRTPTVDFIVPALSELIASGILPVLIGGPITYYPALYQALTNHYDQLNLALIDERIPLYPESNNAPEFWLNPLFSKKHRQLFHLDIIGYQTHFVPPQVLRTIKEHHHHALRLGLARAALQEVEPVIRYADSLGIHLRAIRAADAPGVAGSTPSGFHLEEACQLSRYAGMSDKLKGFGVFGYQPEEDQNRHTAKAAAQLLWYFIEGFYYRKGDFPVSTEGLTEYIVELKKLNYQLTFWKSNKSGRWWIQVPVKVRKRHLRHRLIPCSHSDYRMACQDELSDRLFEAFKRFH